MRELFPWYGDGRCCWVLDGREGMGGSLGSAVGGCAGALGAELSPDSVVAFDEDCPVHGTLSVVYCS